MKKVVLLIAVALIVVSVGLAVAQKKGFTEKDLPGLKGMWTGTLDFGVFDVSTAPCTLEILNDKLPLKGKLTVQNIQAATANNLGIMSDGTFQNDNGTLSTQGTIIWTGPAGGFFEIGPGGEKKLRAQYWFKGVRGTAQLTKK
jgi:hypothetical protein